MIQWVRFFGVLIKYGKLFRPLYWDDEFKENEVSPWKRMLLKTPFVCQVVSLIGLYKLNRQWPQHVYHWPERKLAYIWICKSGSTSILASILQAQHPDLDVPSMSTREIHVLAKANMKSFVQKGYESFAIVRNPYDRMISCFQDKVRNKNQTSYFHSLYFGLFTNNMSFGLFIKMIGRIPDSIKEIHFKQQSSSIANIGKTKIFKFEEFQSNVKAYLESHGLDVSSLRRNKSNSADLRDESKLVKEIYRDDYERFGYKN